MSALSPPLIRGILHYSLFLKLRYVTSIFHHKKSRSEVDRLLKINHRKLENLCVERLINRQHYVSCMCPGFCIYVAFRLHHLANVLQIIEGS